MFMDTTGKDVETAFKQIYILLKWHIGSCKKIYISVLFFTEKKSHMWK